MRTRDIVRQCAARQDSERVNAIMYAASHGDTATVRQVGRLPVCPCQLRTMFAASMVTHDAWIYTMQQAGWAQPPPPPPKSPNPLNGQARWAQNGLLALLS